MSRASVYRILEELEQAQLVARIEVGHGIVRYEPIRHGHGHHHHMVCDRCGRLIPFADEGLERELRRVSEDVASADESGVSGTPSFFINGRRHYGAYDIDSLSNAVRLARARAAVEA